MKSPKFIKLSKVREVKTPTRGTKKSAGIDFYVPKQYGRIVLNPGDSINIPSGIKAEIPEGHALIAFNKSGVALQGFQVGACVVDEDYQGEIHLHVWNYTDNIIVINPQAKLVQFLLIKQNYVDIRLVEEIYLHENKTERGEGGFGSTGQD